MATLMPPRIRRVGALLIYGYICVALLLSATWLTLVLDANGMQAQTTHVLNKDDTVLRAVEKYRKLMDDQETGLRGYLLTGDGLFLQPYTQAVRQILSVQTQALGLAPRESYARPLLRTMIHSATDWRRWAQRTAVRLPADPRSPIVDAQQKRGKLLFDRFRAASSRLLAAVTRDRAKDVQESSRTTTVMGWVSGGILLFALLLIALIGWLTTRAVTGPLRRLGLAAERIGAGDLAQPVEVEGRGEFAVLAQRMDQMRLDLARDKSQRDAAEEQLKHQALHDALTGLPNRTLLNDRIERTIAAAQRDMRKSALLLVDLNGFKEINDTFGHHYGDTVLEELALRLCDALRQSDTVARLGGDEFAVLLHATDEHGATTAVRKIHGTLEQPFIIEGRSFTIGASIGVAMFPDHGDDAQTLLRRADVAMYVAKRTGAPHAVYSPDQDENSPDRLMLASELRNAIESDQLILHFQPQMHVQTGCAEHVEALVRWQHPDWGLIPPDRFIPMAEQTGLIEPLTQWVIDEALRQCRRWRDNGLDISVAVNLSAPTLQHTNIVTIIADLLEAHAVPAYALQVEITESAVMADPEHAMVVLSQLHAMGVWISIDDFGTGYSSLGYLKRLPVDMIKIDRSFVRDMTTKEEDAFIVRAVIDLGHNLGMKVVAEGVENEQILNIVRDMRCDMIQGYFLSRPLPAGELTGWFNDVEPRLRRAS